MRPPQYFSAVSRKAAERWQQLESDPELAGPWWQLFRQVQSPSHVLSELLQNADDAGATEATAAIVGGEFVFSHNGHDFDKEQFASLCGFAFSNKTTLHTIGFRGIGFKSTFSLGDEVRLFTPTLSVVFRKDRFTQPEWIETNDRTRGRTEVRVVLRDDPIKQRLSKSLYSWIDSPASLLFFKNIRCLRVDEQDISWESQGPGPVEGSEWMSVSSTPKCRFLTIRSPEEDFPPAALEEIRNERMISDDEAAFPPCRVDIVLGMEGGLFVVLPTGVWTDLPFACNAPFIQDPSRMSIKEPASSPTNRWLLKRVGELAADALLTWVGQRQLSAEGRCQAYDLLPVSGLGAHGIAADCRDIVVDAFGDILGDTDFVLTETDQLFPTGTCLAVPAELFEVWTPGQVSEVFADSDQPLVSQHVSEANLSKLLACGDIESLTPSDILGMLCSRRAPRPKWDRLLYLWNYLPGLRDFVRTNRRSLKIVPVSGQKVLYSADEVIRLQRRSGFSDSDREFLRPYLTVLDGNWVQYLRERQRDADTADDRELKETVATANEVLRLLGLAESTDPSRVLARVAANFDPRTSTNPIDDCVRLAHIAAKLNVEVPQGFWFVTQGGMFKRPMGTTILVDADGDLDRYIDEDHFKEFVLHEAYGRQTETCTPAEWRQWVLSPKGRVNRFVPLERSSSRYSSRPRLESAVSQRGLKGSLSSHYKRPEYFIRDWDFDRKNMDHWETCAEEDELLWCGIMEKILLGPPTYWSGATTATVYERASNGHERRMPQASLLPNWIARFRGLPCLPDTEGQARKPDELFRRTSGTERFLGIDPFLDSDFDTGATRPLLDLLGVQDKPSGPDRSLQLLRGLAANTSPLIPEVQKWCHWLDQLFDSCSTEDILQIKQAFKNDKLILTEDYEWASTDEVFLIPDDEEVPGAVLIHPYLRDLALWRKIGVADRPSLELAIGWLKTLPSGRHLATSERRRVVRLLESYPTRIWEDCDHWLNLADEWVPVTELDYSLNKQSLVTSGHLFQSVRKKTADFRPLAAEACQMPPFSELATLSEVIEEQFREQIFGLPEPQIKQWLLSLGGGLRRMVLNDSAQMDKVRHLGSRLAQTQLQSAGALEIIPYINGTPAGNARPIRAHWDGNLLYVGEGSAPKLANEIIRTISREFGLHDITNAVTICYERGSGFIEEYMEEHFVLAPVDQIGLIDAPSNRPIAQQSPENDPRAYAILNQAKAESTDTTEPVLSGREIDKVSFVGEVGPAIGAISPGLRMVLEAETFEDAIGQAEELGITGIQGLGNVSNQGNTADLDDDDLPVDRYQEGFGASGDGYVSDDGSIDLPPASPIDAHQDVPPVPFAQKLYEVQTITSSRARQRQVFLPPGGPQTIGSARNHTQVSVQVGRSGSYVSRAISRWEPVEAANDLAEEFRAMVYGDYGQRCQICSRTFTLPGGSLQVYVVHVVPPSADHRTNHFGDLLGLCGWHYSLIRYGEWAFLDPETHQPFVGLDELEGWERLQNAVPNAPRHVDDLGNEYVGLEIRFSNVYEDWESDPTDVVEKVRYSIPHWTYLCQLLQA